jgi:hypothetical protein
MGRSFSTFLFGIFCLATNALAQGGPPLITDDPGTPGNRNWEINLATQIESESDSHLYQGPLVDANYGYGDHLQLNLVAGWNSSVEDGDTVNGLSKVSSAVKWRFLDEEKYGVAISIYPRIDTLFPLSSRDPRINTEGVRYFFPIEFSKEFGKWGINPEIGYAYNTRAPGEWNYGIAASYEFEKDRELLFEIHARAPIGDGLEVIPQIGTRYAFIGQASLIAAIGHTIMTAKDVPDFWNLYFGAQLRL